MPKTQKNGVSKRGRMGEGAPRIVIDYAQVRKLARIQCTQQEIADYLDISADTLQRDEKAMEIYKQGFNRGKVSVRRAQYYHMLRGDKTMLVWLGKQYLNQRDPDRRLTGPDDKPFEPEMDDRELARRAAFLLMRETVEKAKKEEATDAKK